VHYLEQELRGLIQADPYIYEFIESGCIDGLWYWDIKNPEHEYLSDSFWLTLGVDPNSKQHLASEWQDLIDADDLVEALKNFEKHCEDPSHKYDQIVRYRHADGHIVWIRCRGMAIRDEHGTPHRMLGVHSEITHQKTLESLNERLNRSNDDLARFAHSASHDLKEPLRKIAIFSDLLRKRIEGQINDEETYYLDSINDAAKKMQTMIDGLLVLSSISFDRDLKPEPISMYDVVNDIVQHQLYVEGNTVIEIDPNLPNICAPRLVIEQMFINLISNGVKFSSKKSNPRVTIERYGNNCVRVLDNGIGFDTKYIETIFKQFGRLDASGQYQGTGLGMPVCKAAADRIGATIDAESTLGEGATFTITFCRESIIE